jgi:phosphoglycolate phosphatase
MQITGILFDKDGTLFDFQATWGNWAVEFLQGLAGDDTALAARLAARTGLDMATARFRPDSLVIAGTSQQVLDLLLAELPEQAPRALFDSMNQSVARAPVTQAVPLGPLLAELRARGLRLGVATNDAEVAARGHLEQAGIGAAFDLVLGFDSGHGGKPEPGQILAFCDLTGLEPGSIVMVGDSLHDLHAAAAAGARPVGVLTGVAGATELAPHAEVVLPDIGHLPAWLDRA